jgi:CubicO group peptidase (beta-lactamase class C family)
VLLGANIAAAQSGDASIAALIEPIRAAHHLPALGAAIIREDGVTGAVVGVRKAGASIPATIDDKWHLGSDTKAMTAVVVATLVERGMLKWTSTIGEIFPAFAKGFPAEFRKITVAELLSHQAGLTANLDWRAVAKSAPTLREQRVNALKAAAQTKLIAKPGKKYEYSNLGYTIAGAVAEQVVNQQWETLVREIVFNPLGMTSCGFGGTGTPGKIDQPWPHTQDGKPTPANGPEVDNAAVMGPAGIVHCSIADWAKFIGDQLHGERGTGALLKPETYRLLHEPQFGGDYALGWIATPRPWGNGTVLTHSGSNTLNFCVVWIAPKRGFAVLSMTNQGGDDAGKAADEAVSALITNIVH